MPITGPASYVPTTEQFLAHWGITNGVLPAGSPLLLPAIVPGGPAIAVAALEVLYNALLAKRSELQSKLNNQEMARGLINNLKAGLLLRANQFNDAVRALLAGSKYEHALPNVPGVNMGQGLFTEPLEDASDVWEQINADAAIGADIVLLDGYTQIQFESDVTALKSAYRAFNTADIHADFTRSERNTVQNQIYPILKSYRQVLPTKFAATHALVASMPKLSPEPGSTPEPATSVAGSYNTGTNQGHITFAPSSSPDVEKYQMRITLGPVYSDDDDTVVDEVPAAGPYEFFTTHGLGTPGVTISVKIFSITTTGNESASEPITITRPGTVPPGP